MGAVVGLGVGIGLLLIFSAFFVPRSPRRAARTPGRLGELLARAGLPGISPLSFVTLCVMLAVGVAVAIQALTQTAPVALVFATMAAYLPFALVRSRARQRQAEFADVWPDAVDNLASAVRAGLSLPDALSGLGERGPEPLRPAFSSFALDYQVTGRFGDCLDRLKARLSDPVGDRVVEGLRVAREVGGGELGRLLRNLSGYLRDDARLRAEMESRQAWTVNGARLAMSVQQVGFY